MIDLSTCHLGPLLSCGEVALNMYQQMSQNPNRQVKKQM